MIYFKRYVSADVIGFDFCRSDKAYLFKTDLYTNWTQARVVHLKTGDEGF